MFRSQQCRAVGACAEVCEVGAIALIDGVHHLDRERCTMCLECITACPSGALEVTGQRMKLEDVVEESSRDELFYKNSGGGVTLSGGEPLFQPEFARRFMEACKQRSLHTALDTSGHASWENMKRVLEHTDLVLFDLKHLSPEKHMEGTRVKNDLILDNLRKTSQVESTRVWIRIPLIPGYNDSDSHLEELARLAEEISAEKVSLLGFHHWGKSKYRALGREYPYDEDDILPQERLNAAKQILEAHGVEVTVDH
jgi:pyruvate formate lyase activating enzyme